MAINEKANKNYKQLSFTDIFFSLKFVGTIFVSSITSSPIITESLVILAKHLPYSQLYVTRC